MARPESAAGMGSVGSAKGVAERRLGTPVTVAHAAQAAPAAKQRRLRRPHVEQVVAVATTVRPSSAAEAIAAPRPKHALARLEKVATQQMAAAADAVGVCY